MLEINIYLERKASCLLYDSHHQILYGSHNFKTIVAFAYSYRTSEQKMIIDDNLSEDSKTSWQISFFDN